MAAFYAAEICWDDATSPHVAAHLDTASLPDDVQSINFAERTKSAELPPLQQIL